MSFLKHFCLLFSVLPFALSYEDMGNPDLSPSPKIGLPEAQLREGPQLECRSWRMAVESNNISPWKTVPRECADYVEAYMTGKEYEFDLQRVCNDAGLYARSLNVSRDGKYAWIFDVDETLISNLPYYAQHDYGLEIYDSTKFDEWVETGKAPAIKSSLKLYEEVINLGFKVILLTGRSERHRNITAENLSTAGFLHWEKLILRSSEDDGKTAVKYKSDKRRELVEAGYGIVGNFGDQWSDLLGPCMSTRSFKLPNPMYFIP